MKKAKKAARIAVDAAMGIVLVALMATALVQEAPHEWLGVALFVLAIAHIVLNRRWLAAVPRARGSALRVLQLVVLVGLVLCVVGQIASSLVISKHAFGFLPALPGASWARRVHMLCSYWMFMLAFAHAGLHLRLPKLGASWSVWAARIAFAVVACFGAWSFVQLGLGPYLTGQVQFAFVDQSVPIAWSIARYAGVAILVAGAFHYIRAAIAAVS
ncbi:MAG TPA: hypothetical protein DCP91_11310 [Eggerthellaceae bacterium]|nr:hypothetical protein [Eggerthellaceae bacterium]